MKSPEYTEGRKAQISEEEERKEFEAFITSVWSLRGRFSGGIAMLRRQKDGSYYFENVREAWEVWQAARASSPEEATGWISVEERLPDYDVDVCLWAKGWDHVYVGYWRHSEEWIGRHRAEERERPLPGTNPTHWQPLPSPPEEATKKEK